MCIRDRRRSEHVQVTLHAPPTPRATCPAPYTPQARSHPPTRSSAFPEFPTSALTHNASRSPRHCICLQRSLPLPSSPASAPLSFPSNTTRPSSSATTSSPAPIAETPHTAPRFPSSPTPPTLHATSGSTDNRHR